MNQTKRWAALGLTLAMGSVLVLPACSKDDGEAQANKQKDENVNQQGMPIVKEPITLNFFAGRHADSHPDWNEVPLYQDYKSMTNINVKWQMVSNDILDEKRNLTITSGDYPDAFHTAKIPPADLLKYGEEGVFIPLNDLINQYAPNLKALFEKYPAIKKGITMPNGKIYSFPTLYAPDFDSVLAHKAWIKKDWMTALNAKMPQTTDEFYELLKSMKGKDLNGDGSTVIPFAAPKISDIIWYLRGSWGLGNAGELHQHVDLDPKTNAPRFIPTDPKYKEMLQYVNKLYTEGLIDKNIYTINGTEFTAQGKKGQFGSVVTILPQVSHDQKEYEILPPMKGPYGDQLHTLVRSSINQIGSFAITSKNKYPEATVRWIDYFYGDEGVKMFFMGKEGVTYEKQPDGSYAYMEEFKGKTNTYLTWPGGGYPSIVKQEFFQGAESMPISIDSVKKIKPYFIKDAWPLFTFTEEENATMREVSSDIETYVLEAQAKFITGKTSFSEWDKYVEQINKMGLDKYMKVYKAAYERYKSN
ncbi:ABC transporter substrate-binding protein [Paenibacillus sp. J31TS4]|uniref:extracellular solute-binding protein n=1 Tax=Paenibacillus sp. J31TS4 TaxID=2807195 RepID=UPI001B0012D0|nr:extracellular solute-binding protein [Paenibacillus sp. J31TS4]GIP37586.1 ABC transporter substrate-binding protein [Paenibacillus sp. J31TS4]